MGNDNQLEVFENILSKELNFRDFEKATELGIKHQLVINSAKWKEIEDKANKEGLVIDNYLMNFLINNVQL